MNAALILFIAAQISVAGKPLKPADFLDGRAIAGGTGAPVVMLTLTPAAAARVKRLGPTAKIALDGKPAPARFVDNTIELDGQKTFDAAAKLARAISGKAPLPDSLEE
ncbi:hypothetical protein [Sphingomonas sp. SUN039]|uniref:hypothetical protein n=1 Tax=Sphingomonas sp. SUN039 TaxID=2937787 RepID=UPI00216497B8|nr:hypothetical protein [Sphingomonas sp. SUN039]UVO53838.1 hypothetical protein M0209_06770 [Sphingomonas sp. SUN039]